MVFARSKQGSPIKKAKQALFQRFLPRGYFKQTLKGLIGVRMRTILPKLRATQWLIIDEAKPSERSSKVPSFMVVSFDMAVSHLSHILPEFIYTEGNLILI
jgi:hypothetical protein